MTILGWIMLGLIVGVVPKLLILKHDPGGVIVTITVGIVGVVICWFLGRTLGWWWYGKEDPISSIIPMVRAAVVLFVDRQTSAS